MISDGQKKPTQDKCGVGTCEILYWLTVDWYTKNFVKDMGASRSVGNIPNIPTFHGLEIPSLKAESNHFLHIVEQINADFGGYLAFSDKSMKFGTNVP